jgi:hypothetical protein
MESLNKLRVVQVNNLDKENTFILVDSNSWKIPNKISISNFISNIQFEQLNSQIDNNTLIFDSNTLKVIIKPSHVISNVQFIDQDVSIYSLPSSYPDASSISISVDENYLYIWHEKTKKWKRIPLLDLD